MSMMIFDASSFIRGAVALGHAMGEAMEDTDQEVADTLLLLSQKEVPHDEGTLQNSGTVEQDKEGYVIGYNSPYAAKLHEHPEYEFQKGRKGKFLEDPIKQNESIFNKIYVDAVSDTIKKASRL